MRKTCSKCGENKEFSYFYNNKVSKDGKRPDCIECVKANRHTESHRQLRRKYQQSSEYKAKRDEYRKRPEIREKEYKRQKAYLQRPDVADRRAAYFQRKDVKQRRREYEKERRKNPHWRIAGSMSKAISKALKVVGETKRRRHWEDIVGYTKEELVTHLENQFQPGMTWDNYGEWHVDHIVPTAHFDITSVDCDELKKCWALSNLQPLWAADNIRKSDNVPTNVMNRFDQQEN